MSRGDSSRESVLADRAMMRLAFVMMLVGSVFLGACSTPWMAPTEFAFRGLRTGEEKLIEDVFTRKQLAYERVDGPGTNYRVRGIDTTAQLGGLHRALRETIRKNDLQVRLETARLAYAGIAIQSNVEVKVLIEVSGASRAWIADGPVRDPWREIRLNRAGRWYDTISTSGAVTDQNGNLYIFSRDGEVARAQRMQVLTRRMEDIPLDAMPFRPPLR